MADNLDATIEESQVAAPAVEEIVSDEPKQIEDTIRETYRALKEQQAEPAQVEGAAPEDAVEKANRIRDGKGKFAAKEEVAPVVEAVVDPAAPVVEESRAPNTWKKEAAAQWEKLPVEARNEIQRREADFHKGIEGYKQAASFAQEVSKAIAPYENTLRALNVTPTVAIAELMAADHKLRNGSPQDKQAYFAQLAQNYGIDLAGVQAPQQEYIDPNFNALQQQVQQLTGYIQNQQLSAQQQAQASLNSEINAFAADPAHKHFESVKDHMSMLLQAGKAADLKSAYEQAVWLNPTTRADMLQQQAEAQRQEATKKAQAAKAASSINVKTRPSLPVAQPIGTLEDTIRANYRRLTGA